MLTVETSNDGSVIKWSHKTCDDWNVICGCDMLVTYIISMFKTKIAL